MDATTVDRRTWLKQTALSAGAVLGGLALAPNVFAKPAFGMKPLYNNSLVENYAVRPADIEHLKARLLANENPFGPSKKAIAAIGESAVKGNRYVYGSVKKIVEMIAVKEGVPEDHILVSAGSTDVLEKTAFALCRNGGNVVSADPSYLSLVKTAQAIGATWKNIPLTATYAHDMKAMESAIDGETKIVYICNPNNPTGTLTPAEDIRTFVRNVNSKVPVFIDEAYLELLENADSQTTVGLVKEGYDVIVCRTFSKLHGMAGLRIGYMVAKPERIKNVQKLVRTEMAISVTSLEGAIASLNDLEFQNYSRIHIKEGREYLMNELKKSNLNPLPSFTNFILFPIQIPVKEMVDKMMDKGVGIRGFEVNGKPYARVSVGTMDENRLFVQTLKGIVS